MKKIAIYCLGLRRLELLKCHLPQLASATYDDFHFYLLSNQATQEHELLLKKYLPHNSTVVRGFDSNNDYMSKVEYAINRHHLYSVKMDEDCLLTGESWDRLFSLIESMTDSDLFCTGAISNGIPTCDFFIENFIPEARNELFEMFSSTRFGWMGSVDYSPLNSDSSWNPDMFYGKVWGLNHYYKGIHPVRVNFDAARRINDHILKNPHQVMKPIHSKIIRDGSKYPYFCNSLFGIKTEDWKTVVRRRDLFVDPFEEVPLNKYRNENGRNMVIDTGIPILHTMYNWSQDWNYENFLIETLINTYGE